MTVASELLTTQEACDLLRCSYPTLRRLVLRREIMATQIAPGRRGVRYRKSVLDRYIDRKTRLVR